jgi:nitrate/TMAO reductase-like tetraheme cytochrome c subunit
VDVRGEREARDVDVILHKMDALDEQRRRFHDAAFGAHQSTGARVKVNVAFEQTEPLKAHRAVKDFWNESHKTIATEEEWEKRRPLLRTTFENYLTSHNYITCRGCHKLDSIGGPRGQMKVMVH